MDRTRTIRAWERLVRFHRVATHEMDAHLRSRFGRTLDDYDVLHQVRSHDGPIRMGELTDRLLIANSSCTRIVGRLVDDGLLERSHGTEDRREVLVGLTPAGAHEQRRMAAVHTRDIERLFDPLSERRREHLDDALQDLLGPTAS